MHILDDRISIKQLDKSDLGTVAGQLYLQCQQTFDELNKLEIPAEYRKVNKIVLNGMGGSRLGSRVAERLFQDRLKVPLLSLSSYTLPECVDENTLVILSSYSGTTEEILHSYPEAVKRKAKIMVFSQGGELAAIARKNNYPGYFGFTPTYNPHNIPRMSLGYQVLGLIMLLSRCGLLKVNRKEIDGLIGFLKKIKDKWHISVAAEENDAKKIALLLHNKIPVLAAAEFTVGSLHVWRNQINENAKQLAVYFEIPELNHHLLEGMAFPESNPGSLQFIFLKSGLYNERNQKRIEITKKVLDSNKILHSELTLTGSNKLEQAFEIIQLGSFVSYYMALLNGRDPSPNPWVDYFKKQLQ